MNGNQNRGITTLKSAIAEYERYLGERISWLEALGDALTGMDERLDYTNILLIQLLLLWGAPTVPEAPPTITPTGIALPTIYPVRPVIPVMTPLGTPVSKLDRVNITSDTEYQTLVEWKIPDHYFGELFEVSMMADDYTHAQFRLVIANKEQWTDKYLAASLTQWFQGDELTETMLTQIQAKTDNAANPFYAWGEIAGKEYQK